MPENSIIEEPGVAIIHKQRVGHDPATKPYHLVGDELRVSSSAILDQNSIKQPCLSPFSVPTPMYPASRSCGPAELTVTLCLSGQDGSGAAAICRDPELLPTLRGCGTRPPPLSFPESFGCSQDGVFQRAPPLHTINPRHGRAPPVLSALKNNEHFPQARLRPPSLQRAPHHPSPGLSSSDSPGSAASPPHSHEALDSLVHPPGLPDKACSSGKTCPPSAHPRLWAPGCCLSGTEQTNSTREMTKSAFVGTGAPVAKTPCSQCRGPRFGSWSGTRIPQATANSSHAATK